MSYPPKTFSAAQRRRLSRLEREHKILVASNTALRREAKTLAAHLRSEVYQEASAAVIGDVYDALRDLGIGGAEWLSQRLLASREHRKPSDSTRRLNASSFSKSPRT